MSLELIIKYTIFEEKKDIDDFFLSKSLQIISNLLKI